MEYLEINAIDNTYSVYRSIYAPVGSNMYIIIEGNEAIVVDSNICDEVSHLFKEKDVQKVHIFLTHEHYDHSHGVCWFNENFNTILYTHAKCKDMLSTKKNCSPRLVAFVLSAMDMNDGGHRYDDFKKEMTEYTLEPDVYFEDNDVLQIAGHFIKIIHVPGHTPGSCLLELDDELVFTGDSLIEGNKIITSFRGGNIDDMINVALPKLKALPDELIVMPGHGEPFMKKEFNFNIYNV